MVETVSEHVYVIEHLVTHKHTRTHASRLRYYHEQSLEVTEELLEQVNRQGFTYEIEAFKKLRLNKGIKKWQVEVSWQGFESIENSFEPVESILRQTPELFVKFLQEQYRSGNRQAVVKQISKKFKAIILQTMNKYHLDVDTLPLHNA